VRFFELSPRFATDNHITAMNPHWQHILRRPNLQDLRKLKFTRQVVQTKLYNPMNLHIQKLHQTTSLSAISAGYVNLRIFFFVPRTLLSVATAAATVAVMFATFFFSVANIFVIIFRRRFR
jgi:hypothetical protein